MVDPISLTPEIAWVLGVLALTIFLFVSELVRVDVTAISIMVLLALSSAFGPQVVGPNEIFSGFSSNAVISIIAVMILGAGLDKSGVMKQISRPIVRLAGNTETRLIAVVASTVSVISGFIQNIGAVALFLPAVRRIATRTRNPLSRLLMPVGFCAILGGTITLVGSSPLILLNDLVETSNINLPASVEQMELFHLFDVTPVGLALVTTGILYFIFLGKYVLPNTTAESDTSSTMAYLNRTYHVHGDVFQVAIPASSSLKGNTVDYLRKQSNYKISAVALQREGHIRLAPVRDTVFEPGDVLGLLGKWEDVEAFTRNFRLEVRTEMGVLSDVLSPAYSGVSEIVVAPRSSLMGKSMREIKFRQRYRATILALYRSEEAITEKLADIPFQVGDALLVHSSWEDLALLDSDPDFIVLTAYPRQDLGMRPDKVKYALIFFGIAIGLVIFSNLRLSVALMTGAIGMILSGVLRIDEAYRSVDWRTVFLLAGLIPLGIAVEHSDTATWIAQNILALVGDVPQWVLLAVIAVLTTIFTLVMSNVGATVLLVPLAVNIAIGAGADPRVFALAVGLAASNSFLLPTHQVNALIMGPGGYRNRHFLRAGGIMTLLFLLVLIPMLALFYAK
ncbi:MAG: SLC13 family permease [Gammaproteobacteria bacterium]|nr:SLC13 family permease [Gammaproteobacteria bacterium]